MTQVRRGVVWVNRKIQVEPPKSEAGIRDVAIPPNLIPAIKEHLETYAAPGQEGLLFPAANGRQQWPSTITTYFKKASEIAGRSDLRFHDLRHTALSWPPNRAPPSPISRPDWVIQRPTPRSSTSTRPGA